MRRRTPYTILPTPLPEDHSSQLNSMYFADGPTQDQIAVIDACLHNLYDIPRAKHIFDQLRQDKIGDPMLSQRVYNSIIAAYIDMAASKDPSHATQWVDNAISVYEAMESGKDMVAPNANTYASMLIAWQRFNPESDAPVSSIIGLPEPGQLLRQIVDRSIPVSLVITGPAFTSSEEAAKAITDLSKAAVELNLSKIVNELGMANVLGRQLHDPLDSVPEANPVLKLKVIVS